MSFWVGGLELERETSLHTQDGFESELVLFCFLPPLHYVSNSYTGVQYDYV